MRVTLQPSGAQLELRPGERILDGARRLGYDCPQSCRNGNCHVCAALLVEGSVRQDGEVRDHGELFTCLAEPLEDCVLHWDGVLAPGELPVRTLSCQLTLCEPVGGDVWRVRLRVQVGVWREGVRVSVSVGVRADYKLYIALNGPTENSFGGSLQIKTYF